MTDAPFSSGAATPRKVDPETLVLRGNPGRVTRFRRGAIIAMFALSSTAIVGVAWFALKPTALSLVASGNDRPESAAKAPPDALPGAPRSYGDVPRLGPPLPGDLGRSILERQREIAAVTSDPAVEAAQRAAQEAETERQRIAAAQRSARESGVMMQLAGTAQAPAAPLTAEPLVSPTGSPRAAPADANRRLALDPVRDPNGQQRKLDFASQSDASGDVNPHALRAAPSPYTLSAGSIIAASLITGLNSDLPGLVVAQVTQNAYDSVTGRTLLVPQGSRLIGSYDSVVAFGQSRALVIWQRIILPDGSSIRIDNMPATDAAGYAGLSDRIDRHTWQLLKGVALSTLLGVGTELSFGSNESDLVRAIRESTQQSGARAGDQMVTRNLNVQPTLRVRPGWPLRIVVHKDIVLRPWQTLAR
jgi:type IV secretory pathway VirB10-like protein